MVEILNPNKEFAKIKIELKVSPELIIYVGGERLGRIAFENFDDMKEFINSLGKYIKGEIKQYNKGKEVVKTK